jgi:hypothetical protein
MTDVHKTAEPDGILHDDGYFTWKDRSKKPYRSDYAGWRAPFYLVVPTEAEIRRKIVAELRSSAFLHCDVNKEDVLLCIEHGCTLLEARTIEANRKAT